MAIEFSSPAQAMQGVHALTWRFRRRFAHAVAVNSFDPRPVWQRMRHGGSSFSSIVFVSLYEEEAVKRNGDRSSSGGAEPFIRDGG